MVNGNSKGSGKSSSGKNSKFYKGKQKAIHPNRKHYDPRVDRNFDGLAERFQRNIYGSIKGAIRQATILQDLSEWVFEAIPKGKPLRILDAGGGQGQAAIQMAKLGHEVVLLDISQDMLSLAEKNIIEEDVSSRVALRHDSIQQLAKEENNQFDLILCHAVLEWLGDPWATLNDLNSMLKPESYLSLAFYNLHGLVFKNLLRGNFQKVGEKDFRGSRGSLTPNQAIAPEDVWAWLQKQGLQRLGYSGIRVFHDYWLEQPHFEHSDTDIIEQELSFSRQDPYRQFGRYIHTVIFNP